MHGEACIIAEQIAQKRTSPRGDTAAKGTAMARHPRTAHGIVLSLALAMGLACPTAAWCEELGSADANETPILDVVGGPGETTGDENATGDLESAGDADDASESQPDGTGAGQGASGDVPQPEDPAGSSSGSGGSDATSDGTGGAGTADGADGAGSPNKANHAGEPETTGNANASEAGDAAQSDHTTGEASLLTATQEAIDSTETAAYAHQDTATSGSVTLIVEWNDPVLGQPTTFHVSATGGSGKYMFRMDAPMYSDPGAQSSEPVLDSGCDEWPSYTGKVTSQDYEFTMTASGTYTFKFELMDIDAHVYGLSTSTNIQVDDSSYPSVASIVANAVTECNEKAGSSEYEHALWLHDWLLDQLEYDHNLKWSSAESALTRHSGTCQAYKSAYARLLTAAGIENYETLDTYDGHTWNAVKMDGQWYQVDCTWDDSDSTYSNVAARHLYFGLSDELMAVAHKGHAKIYTAADYATPSTSLADNYYVRDGSAAQWASAYTGRIQQHLDSNETSFTITADNLLDPPSIYGITNGITAYQINQSEWSNANGPVSLNARFVGTTFVFSATYSLPDNHLDVATYKHDPADSSTWTTPELPGHAFAGWYSDEERTQVYKETSGYAYARFVPVSELVRFTGCGLRDDGAGPDSATLRFCYEFSVPRGCSLSSASWHWKNTKSGTERDVAVASYWLSGGDSMVANLAVQGVKRAGEKSSFETPYEALGSVSYTTPDGTPVTAAEPQAQSRSVYDAARAVADGGAGSDREVAYARDILGDA